MDIKGGILKKVLFIGPRFYGFETHIEESIQKLGFDVDFYNEKPELNMIFRIYQKMPKNIFNKYLEKYYQNIINIEKEYDFVFIIRAEMMYERYIKVLREKQKKAKFIMYQWDFYENLPHIQSQIKYFDQVYTFDENDAKNFHLKLKPLFYTNNHKLYASAEKNNKYKISFIGSHHSDRFEFINKFKIVNKLDEKDFFYHLYRPKLSFIYNKFFTKNDIGRIKYKEVQSDILSEKNTIDILSQSEMILDIHHVKQAGLTIRSIEALGLKKKLITTNPLIKKYDFYDENNVCLISRKNPIIPAYFFDYKYRELDTKVYDSYHVDEWVKEFFKVDKICK
jgi:hypothetical protein